MLDVMVRVAQHPAAPWLVLCLAAVIVVAEAARLSPPAAWNDLVEDEYE